MLAWEHCEPTGRAGPRHTRRLHSDDGPVVHWPDGTQAYALHGVAVPADLVRSGYSTADILRERNAEVRRIAIDRLGWDEFVASALVRAVHPPIPDPGNPGRTLTLYDVPTHAFDPPARLLICTNATPERDGTLRRYGLWVPALINDAVAAAAWTFDVDPSTYWKLRRAT